MDVVLFYNSSVYQSSAAAAIVRNAFPTVQIFDTTGLNTGAITSQISSISGFVDRIYVLTDVGTNPPAGNLTAAQVIVLDGLLNGAPGDTTTRVIPATNSQVWPLLKNRALLCWEDVYPTVTTPVFIKQIGAFGMWDQLFTGTATGGSAAILVDSGAAFGIVADSFTTTSATTNTVYSFGSVWTVNTYAGYYLNVIAGTAVGQSVQILSNTADTLTLVNNTQTTLDATSVVVIMMTTLKGSYAKIVAGTNAGETRLITANTDVELIFDTPFSAAVDITSLYEVVTYYRSADILTDYYLPLYIQTYLMDISQSQAQLTYTSLIDSDSRLGQGGNGMAVPNQSASTLSTVKSGGKIIYDYLNI